MFALIHTLSPKKKHFVLNKSKLVSVGRGYFSFTESKNKNPLFCKIIICNGNKTMLLEVAKNQFTKFTSVYSKQSLPSVSIEISDSTSIREHATSANIAFTNINGESGIAESLLATSTPIMERHLSVPLITIKNIQSLSGFNRIDTSQIKTLNPLNIDNLNEIPIDIMNEENQLFLNNIEMDNVSNNNQIEINNPEYQDVVGVLSTIINHNDLSEISIDIMNKENQLFLNNIEIEMDNVLNSNQIEIKNPENQNIVGVLPTITNHNDKSIFQN